MAAPSQSANTHAGDWWWECWPQRRACTILESASASHRGAAASLFDQVELAASWRLRRKGQTHLQVPGGGSAGGRDEHAPRTRLRLAPWGSRKLARSGHQELAAWWPSLEPPPLEPPLPTVGCGGEPAPPALDTHRGQPSSRRPACYENRNQLIHNVGHHI